MVTLKDPGLPASSGHQMDSYTEQLSLKKLTHWLSTSYKMRDQDNAYVKMSRKGWATLLLKPQGWHRALQLKGNSQMPVSPWGMKGLDPISTTPGFKIPTQRPPDKFLALKVNGVWIHQLVPQTTEAKQQLLKAQTLSSAIPSRAVQIKPTSQSVSGWGLLGYFKCCCLRVRPLIEHLSRGWLQSSPKVSPLPTLSDLLQVARPSLKETCTHICTSAFVATGRGWVPRSAVSDSHQGVP